MLAKFSETTGAANYFNDVSAKYWAANAIAICAKLGWITGYPDGTFRPDKNVTRAELPLGPIWQPTLNESGS